MSIRNLIIISLLFSIVSCISDNQKKETDVERLNLNGKVKSYLKIVSRTSNSKNDSIESILKEKHRELILFNKNGNIIEKRSFKGNGDIYKKWISIYDSNENEIEKFEIKYPNDTLKRWINKHDRTGNKIESLIYNHKDSLLSHTKSTFNNFNKQTELIILNSKEAKNQPIKVNYQYDNFGNSIKTSTFYQDKSKTEWLTDYDSIGNETEWRVYDRQGVLERKDVYYYTYDKNNNIVEEKNYSSNDFVGSYVVTKYDTSGNEIEYYEYVNDSIFEKDVYHYNSMNDRIKASNYNKEGVLTTEWTYEYKYDAFDNLIIKMSHENGQLKEKRDYKIEYWR